MYYNALCANYFNKEYITVFRLDINGLRFIAVISVVFFHFHVPFFDGGYAGVDIFFVISGYLMHSILSKNELNLSNIFLFYKKRFLRIYPALIVALLLFTALYIAVSPPSIIKSIVIQLVSALTFTSNIYFTKELSNYFSQTSDSYIFLHTWSLGVEFQYYLIFPFFLLIIKKIKIKESYLILISILLSLLLCLFMVHLKQKVAFFNLPFRAWELFLGAYASSLGSSFKCRNNKIIEIICIACLIFFIIFEGNSADWPNIKTLIPTVLTFVVILININNERVLLRGEIFQSIGLWSYSIYLYHWPIASYMMTHGLSGNTWIKLFGIILSVLLGFASFFLIERRKSFLSKSLPKTIAVIVFIISMPIIVTKFEFYKLWTSNEDLYLDSFSRYDNSTQFNGISSNANKTCFLSSKNPTINDYDYSACTKTSKNKRTILLFGDSHVAQFSKAIREKYYDYNIIQATASGCPPILNAKGAQYCVDLMNLTFDKIVKEKNIDIAFVGADWNNFMSTNDIVNGIKSTDAILKKNIKDVRFISQTKHYPTNLYILLLSNKNGENLSPDDATLQVYKNMHSQIKGVSFIDIYDYGCIQGKCHVINDNGVPMFFDNNHYTYEWTQKIVNDKF